MMFMLLPAVNLINLNVSRILERASEIGVRKSFGASSRTLVGQFVVENIVLTTVGGALALLLATFILAWVSATGLLGPSRWWSALGCSSAAWRSRPAVRPGVRGLPGLEDGADASAGRR